MPPPDGGLWNGRKVADWMSNHLECPIHPQRGWEYLRSFDMRLKVPRPAHELADEVEQENWKKKLEQTSKEIRQKFPGSEVEIWAMDEHRLGLKPILRRVWVLEGEQPIAVEKSCTKATNLIKKRGVLGNNLNNIEKTRAF